MRHTWPLRVLCVLIGLFLPLTPDVINKTIEFNTSGEHGKLVFLQADASTIRIVSALACAVIALLIGHILSIWYKNLNLPGWPFLVTACVAIISLKYFLTPFLFWLVDTLALLVVDIVGIVLLVAAIIWGIKHIHFYYYRG